MMDCQNPGVNGFAFCADKRDFRTAHDILVRTFAPLPVRMSRFDVDKISPPGLAGFTAKIFTAL
jgi:hypothetical protein